VTNTADTTAPTAAPAPTLTAEPVSAAAGDVEALQTLLSGLVREREELRGRAAAREALETNRAAIVRAQWQLSHALIARYRPDEQAA
jgi:hypothetical protein